MSFEWDGEKEWDLSGYEGGGWGWLVNWAERESSARGGGAGYWTGV